MLRSLETLYTFILSLLLFFSSTDEEKTVCILKYLRICLSCLNSYSICYVVLLYVTIFFQIQIQMVICKIYDFSTFSLFIHLIRLSYTVLLYFLRSVLLSNSVVELYLSWIFLIFQKDYQRNKIGILCKR